MQKVHRYKAHPWHGISPGEHFPDVLTCFIEIVQTDTVKYEVDKQTGYLSIDRPQKFSNIIPALYGFIPQTYCDASVAAITANALGRDDIEGDHDPLDICVLTEKDITHGDIIVKARPIGGFRLLDLGAADDKIIAVLDNDAIYSGFDDITQIPSKVVERLVHYFTTYKNLPTKEPRTVLTDIYSRDVACDVIRGAREDYERNFRHLVK
ncbi:MAG: inorganic pyrophosphatase [Rikenellaceae bacterium]|nr:inorganic pyrophosphatase [Rikenellaceae bacterium]